MRGSENSSLGRRGNRAVDTAPADDALSRVDELRRVIEQVTAQLSRLEQRVSAQAEAATGAPSSGILTIEPSSKIPDIVEELLQAKVSDGLSARYLETIRSHLHRFAAEFQDEVNAVTTKQIEGWLRSLEIGGRARNNIRNSIVLFFRFAQKQGYLPKGIPTEAEDVTKAKDRGGKIGILRPPELAHILSEARDKTQLFIALGAFTGMRSSEILRLDWNAINLGRKFVTVAADKAKTATRRLVPIQPNLVNWLGPHAQQSGNLFHGRRDVGRAIAFARACGVEWTNNVLRHSYATYRLAITANAARVALEMGNSPQKLMSHYRELVDETEAIAWFAISPRD
jgi:integrase